MSSEGSGSGSSSNANRSTEGNRVPNANPGQTTPSTNHASTTNPGPSIRGDELPLHQVYNGNSSDAPLEEPVAPPIHIHGRGPSRGGHWFGPPRPPKEYRGPAIMHASNSSRPRMNQERSPDHASATTPGPTIRGDELPLHHVFGRNAFNGPPEEHVAFQMYNHGRGPSRGGPSLGPPRPPKEYRGPAIMHASNRRPRPKRARSPDQLQAMDGEVSDAASAVQERPNPLRALVNSAVAEVDQRVAELGTRAPQQEADQEVESSNEPINNQANQAAERGSPPNNNRVPDLNEMPPPEDDKCS